MNDLTVDVYLWGKNVGTLLWDDEKEVASFQYDKLFLDSGLDVSPLMMPLDRSGGEVYQFMENRTNCFKGLPGLVADSLPDAFGNQIIDEWFAAEGLPDEQITPLDRLCYVGERAMGAMEFKPMKSMEGLERSTVLHINELMSLAEDVFKNKEQFQSKLLNQDKRILDILKVGTSAGGAKPKAIIAYNQSTNEVRSGQVKAPEGFSYWLLKFDGGTYSEHAHITENPKGIGNIEYAYYLMAKDCGIDIMESKLLQEGDSFHFMTKRFDRGDKGEKFHVQTLAGIAHYDRDQRHSYEEIFRIMRKLSFSYPDQKQFFLRMVFNVMARNHDDHTKNHSFIMDKVGKWRLAPAYDLCYSYSPNGKWTNKHQMSLNGKRDGFVFEDLLRVADKMGVKESKEIIDQVVNSISKWNEFAQEAGVNSNHSRQIQNKLLSLEPMKYIDRENDMGM